VSLCVCLQNSLGAVLCLAVAIYVAVATSVAVATGVAVAGPTDAPAGDDTLRALWRRRVSGLLALHHSQAAHSASGFSES
jgi:hypothetical protein